MESRRIISSVLDVLEMKSPSNPGETITEVLLDGSYTYADLRAIYNNETFPSNKFNDLNVPEGEYGQQDAMIAFVNTISPYLSDQALYLLTDRIMAIETELQITQTLRTATILKPLLWAEINRHTVNAADGSLPDTLISHMHNHILPLCQKLWPTGLENNINTFVSFNIMQGGALTDSLSQEAQGKFTGNNNVRAYEQISNFDAAKFNPSSLSDVAPRNPAEFQSELASLRTEYDVQRRSYESGAATPLQGPKISAQEAAAMRAFEQRQNQAKAQQAIPLKPADNKPKFSLKEFGRTLSQRFRPSSPREDITISSPASAKASSAPVLSESVEPANEGKKKSRSSLNVKAKLSRVSSRFFNKHKGNGDDVEISSPIPARRESTANPDTPTPESTASPEAPASKNSERQESQYQAASANAAISKHISQDDFYMRPEQAAYMLSKRPQKQLIIHLSDNNKYQITYREGGEIKQSRELWGVPALESYLTTKVLPALDRVEQFKPGPGNK